MQPFGLNKNPRCVYSRATARDFITVAERVHLCAGHRRRWVFCGDHPGGTAATPPQRGTLAAMGRGVFWGTTPAAQPPPLRRGKLCLRRGEGVVIVLPPPDGLATATPRQNHPRKQSLRGARAAVGIRGNHPGTTTHENCIFAGPGIVPPPPQRGTLAAMGRG